MDRLPIVAGQFYPASPKALAAEVKHYLGQVLAEKGEPATLVMLPHAGYVYSAGVAGKTLSQVKLAKRIILLGPNHTGYGKPLSVWPDGNWLVPGHKLAVDSEMVELILANAPGFEADYEAHMGEHSLEVELPFLAALQPEARITPISVSLRNLAALEAAGQGLAKAIRLSPTPASLVVSSDMSHYLPQAKTKEMDNQAIEPILGLDPAGLYNAVRQRNISMCGVLPMTLGLYAALALGASQAKLADYATSGDINGDHSRVVGYAGVVVS